jgi:hypothetical protein
MRVTVHSRASPDADMGAVALVGLDVGVTSGANDTAEAQQAHHHDQLANHKKAPIAAPMCAAIGESAIAVPRAH